MIADKTEIIEVLPLAFFFLYIDYTSDFKAYMHISPDDSKPKLTAQPAKYLQPWLL